MRTLRFLFAMIVAAILLQGTSLASQSNSAAQQTPSQKTEQSTSNQQTNGEARGEKEQTPSAQADEGTRPPAGASRTAKHRSRAGSSKPISTHPAAPAKTSTAKNHGSEVPGSVAKQQTGLKAVAAVSRKAASRRSVPVPPATVAVNGQQIKNSRDPGARLAVSGGAINSKGDTAVINGSDIKRKP